MILLEFSMIPVGKGESVGKLVSRSVDIIDKSGVDYQLNSMGTLLEGEWDEVMGVMKKCYERMKQDCPRIIVSMKMDHREGPKGRLKSKIQAVERDLGRELTT